MNMLTMTDNEKQVFEIKQDMKHIKLVLDQLERQSDYLRNEFSFLEDRLIDLQASLRKVI